jgi:hypothetical protein
LLQVGVGRVGKGSRQVFSSDSTYEYEYKAYIYHAMPSCIVVPLLYFVVSEEISVESSNRSKIFSVFNCREG